MADVDVLAVNCGDKAISHVHVDEVQLVDVTGAIGKARRVAFTAGVGTAQSQEIRFSADAGNYFLRVVYGRCVGEMDLILLPGDHRAITFNPRPDLPLFHEWLSHNSLAGHLPFGGIAAQLIACAQASADPSDDSGCTRYSAKSGAGTYYFEALPGAAHWYLALTTDPRFRSVYLPISGILPTDHYRHLIRNISLSDMAFPTQHPCIRLLDGKPCGAALSPP